MGWGTHSAPSEGEGLIELTPEQDELANKNWDIVVNADLTLTITEPIKVPTEEDTFREAIKAKGVANINASDALEWTKIEMRKRGYE